MIKIVLISCVSKKKSYETTAANLYDSPLFKYALAYGQTLNPDKVYILSALYGLVDLDEVIKPYEKTLNEMSAQERKEWSHKVIDQMKEKQLDLQKDQFIFLAGNNYRKYLVKEINNYEIPLKGLRIGEQLSYLKGVVGQ